MNWVNSRNDFGYDDSTINIAVVIIIVISIVSKPLDESNWFGMEAFFYLSCTVLEGNLGISEK